MLKAPSAGSGLFFPDLLLFFLGMFCYSSHGLTGWITELGVALVVTVLPGSW